MESVEDLEFYWDLHSNDQAIQKILNLKIKEIEEFNKEINRFLIIKCLEISLDYITEDKEEQFLIYNINHFINQEVWDNKYNYYIKNNINENLTNYIDDIYCEFVNKVKELSNLSKYNKNEIFNLYIDILKSILVC